MSLKIDFTTKEALKHSNSVKKYIYMDIGTSNFDIVKDRISGAEKILDINTTNFDKSAVKASINNILNFKTGECPLAPEFGVGQLYELLYSPNDKYTFEKILKTVETILNTWEPRIKIISMPLEHDDITVKITINYEIPALNAIDSYIYLFTR